MSSVNKGGIVYHTDDGITLQHCSFSARTYKLSSPQGMFPVCYCKAYFMEMLVFSQFGRFMLVKNNVICYATHFEHLAYLRYTLSGQKKYHYMKNLFFYRNINYLSSYYQQYVI